MSGILNLTLTTFLASGGGPPVGTISSIRGSSGTYIANPIRIFVQGDTLIMVAKTFGPNSLFGFTVAKLPLDLSAFTWQTALVSTSNTPTANDVTIDSSGAIVICGQIFVSFNNLTFPYLSKFLSNGTHSWSRYLNQRGSWTSVTTDTSDNIYAVGTGRWAASNKDDVIYTKYSSNGATVSFQRTLTSQDGTAANGYGYGVSMLNATSYCMGFSVGNNVFTNPTDYQVIRGIFNRTTGVLESALQYGSTSNIWQFGGATVAGEAADTIYEVFTTYVSNTATRGTTVLVKSTTAGGTIWQSQFADASISVIGESLCMDATGANIYVVSGTFSGATATGRNEVQITKWATDGTLVWQRSVKSPTNSLQQPRIAADSVGNFYVSFYSTPVSLNDRAVILKMPGDGSGSGNTATVDGIVYNYVTTTRTASTSTLPVASFTRPSQTFSHPNIQPSITTAAGGYVETDAPF